MKKPHNSKKYARENTGLTPDYKKKVTRKKKRTITNKENKYNGTKPST